MIVLSKRCIKVIEVLPINFLLRSVREQRSIIYSFVSYLKISPVKMQFKIITKKADTKKHRDIVLKEMEKETDERCRRLQRDYLKLINRIGSKEATTRRFFIAFEYENGGRRVKNDESEAVAALQTAARTAVNYLKQCGNKVIIPDNEDEFTADILYGIICRDESFKKPLAEKTANEYTDERMMLSNGMVKARRMFALAGRYRRPAAISPRRKSPMRCTCGSTSARAFAHPGSTRSFNGLMFDCVMHLTVRRVAVLMTGVVWFSRDGFTNVRNRGGNAARLCSD